MATEEWTMGYLQASVENLKTGQEQIVARIDDTNGRINETNIRIDQTNARIDDTNTRMDTGFAAINARMDRMFYLALAASTGVIASLVGTMITLILTQ